MNETEEHSYRVRSFAFGETGYRGVYWDASKKTWRAEIGNRYRGTLRRLGNFGTPALAAEAYDKAAMEMYGDKAVLNFPLNGYRVVEDCSDGHPAHCSRGHLMDEANTYLRNGGKQRACRACNREAANRYYARKSALSRLRTGEKG